MAANTPMVLILYSPETSQGKSSFARELLAAAARNGEQYEGWLSNPRQKVVGVDCDASRESKEHTLSEWHSNLTLDVPLPFALEDESFKVEGQEVDVIIMDFGGAPSQEEMRRMMGLEEGLILSFITFDKKGYRLGINKLRQLSRFQKTLGIMSHVKAGEALEQNRDTSELAEALLFYRDDVLVNRFEQHKILNSLYGHGLLAGMRKKVSNEETALMQNMNALWKEIEERYGNPYR